MTRSFTKDGERVQSQKTPDCRNISRDMLKTKQRHTAARHVVRHLFDRYVKPHHP